MPIANLSSIVAGFEQHDPGRGRGAAMISLLEALGVAVGARTAFPLRSLHSVVLLSIDDWQSPWHVRIDVDAFPFPNLDPAHLQNLDSAPIAFQISTNSGAAHHVLGVVIRHDAAVQLVLEAMDRSGAWPQSHANFSEISEDELIAGLDAHDLLVVRCVTGAIAFTEFLEAYDDFYARWALDGHESSSQARSDLLRHAARVAVHERVWFEVLCTHTSDELAHQAPAAAAGLIGATNALQRLRVIAEEAGLTGFPTEREASG